MDILAIYIVDINSNNFYVRIRERVSMDKLM